MPLDKVFSIFSLLFTTLTPTPSPSSQISPPPPPTPAFISQASHASRLLPQIALTFDADMSPQMLDELEKGQVVSWYDPKIIQILEEEQIPATIFISGLWAKTYPKLTAALAKNPLFEIGNHSYSHPRFTSDCSALSPIPSWGKNGEFTQSQDIIQEITGSRPRYFRFPGGCRSYLDIKLANKYGLSVIDWDVASGDSGNYNRKAIIDTVKRKTQNGSIILFHLDGGKNAPLTSDVLPELIDFFRQKSFVPVKLSDLFSSQAKIESP